MPLCPFFGIGITINGPAEKAVDEVIKDRKTLKWGYAMARPLSNN
jgi:hypothetical protein